MGLNRFPLKDFSGGLNLRDDVSVIMPNESPRLLNVTLGPAGQLQQRPGSRLDPDYQGFNLNYNGITNGFLWRGNHTNDIMVVSVNGDVRDIAADTLLFDGTPGTVWAFENMLLSGADTLFMVNGADTPQRWQRAGRTVAAGGWLAANPAARGLKMWKERMFSFGSLNRLYFSDVGNPETTTYGFIDLGDPSDRIMDLAVFGDDLIVLKNRSIWRIYDPVSMANRRVGTPGCEGRFQHAEADNRLYWFSRTGVYSMGLGGDIRCETEQVSPLFSTGGDPPGAPIQFDRVYIQDQSLETARVQRTPNRRILVSYAGWYTEQVASGDPNVMLEVIPNATRPRGGRYSSRSAIMLHKYSVTDEEDWSSQAPSAMIYVPGGGGERDRVSAGWHAAYGLYDITSGGSYELSPGLFAYPMIDFYVPGRQGINIFSYWYSAIRGIQEEEPIERVRRVNTTYNGQFSLDMLRDFESAPPVQSSNILPNVETDRGFGNQPYFEMGRLRPESRARYHQVLIRGVDPELWPVDVQQTHNGRGWSISSIELVYRGGKEH